MNWDAIGAIAEILGALAVVFSLVYLARQIKLSSKIEQAAAERSVMSAYSDVQAQVAGTPENAKIFLSGLLDSSKLTDAERVTFTTFCTALITHNLMLMEMHEKNLVKDDLLTSSDAAVVSLLKSPGARKWWDEFGSGFPTHQYDRIETRLKTDTSTPALSESSFFFGRDLDVSA